MTDIMRIPEYDELVEKIETELRGKAPLVTWQLLRARQMPWPVVLYSTDELVPDAAPLELRIKARIDGTSFDRWCEFSVLEYKMVMANGDDFVDVLRSRITHSIGGFFMGFDE